MVTLNDGQEYTAERLESDPTALLISLMVSWRAHEESKTKGRRVAAAWAEKRQRVRRGEDKLLTRRAPAWLEWAGDEWEPIKHHAETVQRVYKMTLQGSGEHAIAKAFNEEGVPVMGRGKAWHRSTISKLLRNPSVIGELVPGRIEFDSNGKKRRVAEDPIPDAYPAVISKDHWLAVRALKDGNTSSPRGRGANRPIQNLFAGLAKCPECGASMTRVFKGKKSGGQPKLVCTLAKVGKAKHYKSINLRDCEGALLRNWGALFADVPAPDGGEQLDKEVHNLEAVIQVKLDHMEELAKELEKGPSQTLSKAVRRIEEELSTLGGALDDLKERRELTDGGMVAMRLETLRDALEPEEGTLDKAKVNASLRSLFDGVVVDHREGFLRFQWKQGGETPLMYSWQD